jgi:hypothetical protein
MSAILLTNFDPHPPDCPAFDYETHADCRILLPARVSDVLVCLARGEIDSREAVLNTRPSHYRLFVGLTPPNCDYFAGHYRGELFRCLRHYRVTIPSDTRVGSPPVAVEYDLRQLGGIIGAGFAALDTGPPLSARDRLRYLIVFVCRVFELFLRVHPYANGNGHVARLMVWFMFLRYGYWPRRWSVEPRPADPPYSDFIRRYRDGDARPLEALITSMLVP